MGSNGKSTKTESLKDDQFEGNKNKDIENLIQSLTEKNLPTNAEQSAPPTERKTFRMESSVLSRLQSFLPQLAASNSNLMQENSMEDKGLGFHLEEIESDSEKESEEENIIEKPSDDLYAGKPEEFKPYIEMDLKVGVFDVANDPKTLDTLAAHCESSYVEDVLVSATPEAIKPPTIEEL